MFLFCKGSERFWGSYPLFFNVSHPDVFLQFIQDTNSSQTQQFYYIITFKTTRFDSTESSLGLLENRFIVMYIGSVLQKVWWWLSRIYIGSVLQKAWWWLNRIYTGSVLQKVWWWLSRIYIWSVLQKAWWWLNRIYIGSVLQKAWWWLSRIYIGSVLQKAWWWLSRIYIGSVLQKAWWWLSTVETCCLKCNCIIKLCLTGIYNLYDSRPLI